MEILFIKDYDICLRKRTSISLDKIFHSLRIKNRLVFNTITNKS